MIWRYPPRMHHAAPMPSQNDMVARFYSLNFNHAVFWAPSPPLDAQYAQPAPVVAKKPSKPCLFLDRLPIEVRFRIYDTLIHTHRILSLDHMNVHNRRIGIMEPLAQTNRVIRAEIREWAAGRPRLTRSPLWGLFNPYQSQVCVRYRDADGYATYVFIGVPLSPEKVEKITLWWRCMERARTDYCRRVNDQVEMELTYNGGVYGLNGDYDELQLAINEYSMKLGGDYGRMPIELPL